MFLSTWDAIWEQMEYLVHLNTHNIEAWMHDEATECSCVNLSNQKIDQQIRNRESTLCSLTFGN